MGRRPVPSAVHDPNPNALPDFATATRTPEQPAASRAADPGTPGRARVTWLIVAVLLAAVVALQQGLGRAGGHKAGAAKPAAEAIQPPELDQQLLIAKMTVKLSRLASFASQTGPLQQELKTAARTPLDRVRAAVVLAELAGPDEARAMLAKAEADLPEGSPLREDVQVLRALYVAKPAEGVPPAAGSAAAAPAEQAPAAPEEAAAAAAATDFSGLVARHGYYGRLASVYGRPDTDAERARLIGGGQVLMVVLVAAALVGGLAVLAGMVLAVVAIAMAVTGNLRPRFQRPGPGGSVLLELLAVFMLAFIALKGVSFGLHALGGPKAASVGTLLAQWTLLAVVLYPVARGVPWSRTRDLLGLRAPRGVLREVGAGIVGYLACLPILIAAVLGTLLANFLWELVKSKTGGGPSTPPSNPLFEYFSAGSAFEIVLIALLGTIWAPLCEEIVFRGATLRHLSGRLHPVVAAVPTAVIFALMHGYPILLMGPVLGLGFSFGLLRYWRGSLIPCITAHALHNGAVMALLITLTGLLRD